MKTSMVSTSRISEINVTFLATNESFLLVGLPNTKELLNALAFHQLVEKITPPSWRGALDNMSMEDLCDLHDKSYTRQVVLDNHMNDRTRDLVRTLQRAREKMDTILAKEKKKDQEFADLRAKCEEALEDLEKNPMVLDLRKDV